MTRLTNKRNFISIFLYVSLCFFSYSTTHQIYIFLLHELRKSKMNVLSISKYICRCLLLHTCKLNQTCLSYGPFLVNLSSGCQKYWLFSQNQTLENKLPFTQQIHHNNRKTKYFVLHNLPSFVHLFTLLIIGFLIEN